jgi:hypothetical protein
MDTFPEVEGGKTFTGPVVGGDKGRKKEKLRDKKEWKEQKRKTERGHRHSGKSRQL